MIIKIQIPNVIIMCIKMKHLLVGLSLIPYSYYSFMSSSKLMIIKSIKEYLVSLCSLYHYWYLRVSKIPQSNFIIGTCTNLILILLIPVHTGLMCKITQFLEIGSIIEIKDRDILIRDRRYNVGSKWITLHVLGIRVG